MKGTKQWWILLAAAAVLPFLILSPNPFGNTPDVIADESYFLSSALSALQARTLPGWEFSASGAYYGGPQTYLVTAAAALVVAGMVVFTGSISDAQFYIATHIGSLIHIVRVVNGLAVVLLLWFLMWWSWRAEDRDAKRRLWLLVALLVGNSLFVSMAHTGRVWPMQTVFDIAAAALVLLREYRCISRGYIISLLALTVAAASQTITGLCTGAWIIYALYLRHFRLRELWRGIKVIIPFGLIAAVLQVSIFYRSLIVAHKNSSGLTNINASAFLINGGIDWLKRLLWPLDVALHSQPVVVVAFVVLIGYWIACRKHELVKNRLLHVAIAHSLLTLGVFHGLLGLGSANRFVLPLTVALTISVVLLVSPSRYVWVTLFSASLVLAVFVGFHTIRIWWQAAAEKQVTELIRTQYNNPHYAFFIRTSRFSLPINSVSLEYLSAKEQQFGRNAYLLQHKDELALHEDFSSLSIKHLSTTPPPYQDLERKGYTVFELTSNCSLVCKPGELAAGTCRQVNAEVCQGSRKSEVPTVSDMIQVKRLGPPFAIRLLTQ